MGGDITTSPNKEISPPQSGVTRRKFLGQSAAALGAGVAALSGVGLGSAEAAGSSEEIKYHEKFPGLDFHPIEVEGQPVEGNLEGTRLQGFWFHAQNGQRISASISQLDDTAREEYIACDLYDQGGLIKGGRLEVEANILEEGDYFLVLQKRQDYLGEENRFRVEVSDYYEHGVRVAFRRHPQSGRAFLTRYSPDQLQVFGDGDFNLVIDFNKPIFKQHPDGSWDLNPNVEIEVYAQRGGPEQAFNNQHPDYDQKNRINYSTSPLAVDKIEVIPLDNEGRRMDEWSSGSHIVMVIKDHNTLDSGGLPLVWKHSFFTLERGGVSPSTPQPIPTPGPSPIDLLPGSRKV